VDEETERSGHAARPDGDRPGRPVRRRPVVTAPPTRTARQPDERPEPEAHAAGVDAPELAAQAHPDGGAAPRSGRATAVADGERAPTEAGPAAEAPGPSGDRRVHRLRDLSPSARRIAVVLALLLTVPFVLSLVDLHREGWV
jgi:hypothetical protein